MKYLIWAMLLLPLVSHAEIEVLEISGASNFEDGRRELTSTGLPVIYAGMGGLEAHCNERNRDGLCNTCNDLNSRFSVCIQARVYDSLDLIMTFRSDVANSEGRALLETADGVRVPLSSPTFVMTSGAAHRVEVKWRELCSVISEGSTCEGLSTTGQIKLLLELDGDVVDSQSFTVVVADPDPAKTGQLDTLDLCPDSDGTAASGGVCNFQVHGGHHFVRFSMFGVNGGFPNANLVPVDRVRVFMSEMSFTELVDPNSGLMPQDLKVRTEADGNITIDNLVHGLRPRTEYFFRLGVVDKAGNLSRVTSDQAIIDQCGALGFPTVECPFAAMTYAH